MRIPKFGSPSARWACAAAASLLLLATAWFPRAQPRAAQAAPAGDPDPAIPANPQPRREGGWWKDPTSQFMFYAVLEGLYADGVQTEAINLILPMVPVRESVDVDGKVVKTGGYRDEFAHFVYTCPMCHPTVDALLLYASRQPFVGQKAAVADTFGNGLDPATMAELRSPDLVKRLTAIRNLVDRWAARRLDAMRLTPAERADWTKRLNALKENGSKRLKSFQSNSNGDYFKNKYADWKFCPACDGGADAAKHPAPAHP